jgi:hypothetical protein
MGPLFGPPHQCSTMHDQSAVYSMRGTNMATTSWLFVVCGEAEWSARLGGRRCLRKTCSAGMRDGGTPGRRRARSAGEGGYPPPPPCPCRSSAAQAPTLLARHGMQTLEHLRPHEVAAHEGLSLGQARPGDKGHLGHLVATGLDGRVDWVLLAHIPAPGSRHGREHLLQTRPVLGHREAGLEIGRQEPRGIRRIQRPRASTRMRC